MDNLIYEIENELKTFEYSYSNEEERVSVKRVKAL